MVRYLDYIIRQFDKKDKSSCAIKSKAVKNGYIILGSYESCKELVKRFREGLSQDDKHWAVVDLKGNMIKRK